MFVSYSPPPPAATPPSTNFWNKPYVFMGATVLATAVVTVLVDKAVPALYRKIKSKCPGCRPRLQWNANMPLQNHIPAAVQNVGTLRTDLQNIDWLLRNNGFQRNPLACMNRGWFRDSLSFLGYRYHQPGGATMDLTFNQSQLDRLYHMPQGVQPLTIDPTVSTILGEYERQVAPNWAQNLQNYLAPPPVSRYARIAQQNLNLYVGQNAVLNLIQNGVNNILPNALLVNLNNYLLLQNPIEGHWYHDMQTNQKHLTFSRIQNGVRGEPSAMLTFY